VQRIIVCLVLLVLLSYCEINIGPCGYTIGDVSISVVVTFLLTIILYTTVLLVGCAVWRHSNHAKEQ
jgi:hypothetical protein